MVLQKGNKRRHGKGAAGLTAPFTLAKCRCLALVVKPFGQAMSETPNGIIRIVRVVTIVLTCQGHMHRVMNVIIPLCIVLSSTVRSASQVSGSIVVIFQDEMYLAFIACACAYCFCQFDKNIGFRLIDDGVNSIQPKSVKVVFIQPVERIVNEEVADHAATRTIEVDCLPPRRAMPRGKELRSISAQIV